MSYLLCNYSTASSTRQAMMNTYDGSTIAANSLRESLMCISFSYVYNIESQSWLVCK